MTTNSNTSLPTPSSTPTADLSNSDLQTQLAQLESLGHTNKLKNLKLLKKTNGNVQVVAQFLMAHEQFRRAVKAYKNVSREEKCKRKLEKIKHKNANSSSTCSGKQDTTKNVKEEQNQLLKNLVKEEKECQPVTTKDKVETKTEMIKSDKNESDDTSSSSDSGEQDTKKQMKKILKEEKRQMKKKAKEEKKQMKKLTKEEKKHNKKAQKYDVDSSDSSSDEEEKYRLKQQKKELKRIAREQQKAERGEKKALPTELPEGIKAVYLDGNNMMYVIKALRASGIKNQGKLLEAIARAWNIKEAQRLTQVVLIFDKINYSIEEENGFKVFSARPHFQTSDDALLYWSQQMTPEQANTVAIFTSDRALTEKLVTKGVHVFKSKGWFEIASKALGRTPEESLDNWADRWFAENGTK